MAPWDKLRPCFAGFVDFAKDESHAAAAAASRSSHLKFYIEYHVAVVRRGCNFVVDKDADEPQ